MLAADWQNPLLPVDVNGDTVVAAQDALIVINELDSPKISGSGGALPALGPGSRRRPTSMFRAMAASHAGRTDGH